MSTIEIQDTVNDIKETQVLEKAADKATDKATRKSSTSATDKESSSKRASTHIWAAKDPWSGNPGEKAPKSKNPKNSSAKNEKFKKPFKDSKESKEALRYQPKLMLEEDFEMKTTLIKIGRHTSIRQIIQYALDKIRNDWVVTLNAF